MSSPSVAVAARCARSRGARWLPLGIALSFAAGCSSPLRRFPLREPIWVDTDLQPVHVPCKPDPEEPGRQLCRPATYVSPFLWDVADNTLFGPVSRYFAAEYVRPSVNVNALDEVPDSSWFINRIGRRPMSREELSRGSCGSSRIDPERSAPGSWVIDMGKPDGSNPGFRVNIEGVGRFMLKADPVGEGERATGAAAIASRLYHAAGWYAPCETVVHFDRALLSLRPGLRSADNSGVERDFDQRALDQVLDAANQRGGKVRMVASRWLDGRTIGPFRYEGVREDDPNDVIPHEDRRDLRGARLIAAWLGHFDAREQNTMTTWMARDPKEKDSSPGHTLHYYLDFGDCFGSPWQWDVLTRRLNHAYYLDVEQIVADLFGLGLRQRPWDRASIEPGQEIFGYYSAELDPEAWRSGYPNPAFARMGEGDAAWAARILARFSDELVAAAVDAGDFAEPRHSAFLAATLQRRRDAILRRYFAVLSPLTDVVAEGGRVCATDLARSSGLWDEARFRHAARAWIGAELREHGPVRVELGSAGRVCASLPTSGAPLGLAADDPPRYVVLDLVNGVSPGPLRLHFYDLGADEGHRLVGIERPESGSPP